ncbi:MAG: hypothetical protein CBB92_03530 [Flammeovirgaceae bacterium TMED32]|nr:NUDIX hydrolase [Rhodospirillaceae bacterium]OUU01247.1 MAG: hypothetical protein CBB92_03530 [Flammeovirgaceae bacterium TMED32]|tara:strand:+ start:1502 stop:1963 length:462 start_codon:yes stop_codon:yes gene_type:complete
MILEPDIRNGARAIILRGRELLLLRKENPLYGVRYALPGGSQDSGETLTQTLVRECEEEIGVAVSNHQLIHVADYFKPRATTPKSFRHVVEFLFSCTVPSQYEAKCGPKPDKHQTDVVWVALSDLDEMPLNPRYLATILKSDTELPFYLGRIE